MRKGQVKARIQKVIMADSGFGKNVSYENT